MREYMSQERIDDCIEFTSVRKEFLNEWFSQNKGHITDNMIIDTLKDHEHKMCYHGLEGLEICWSYILNISAKHALVCAGRPCRNEFMKIKSI
jgi:hypothetical protein